MKRILLSALVLALAALGAWFGLSHRGADESAEGAKPTARVETALVKRQIIVRTLAVFGVVASAPSGEQVIAAPYECVVRKIHVSAGTTVAAGDRLMEIDPSPETKLQLDSARGTLALAAQALAATQERYDLKLANRQDLLAAQQAEQDARLKVASLEARGLAGNGQITAAAPGIVGKLELSVGSLVPVGTALVSVASQQGLEVRLGVEAADVAQIHPGQTVNLLSSNRSETTPVVASVRLVGRAIDATTGAAEVRVPLPAGAPLLLGEHVKATIEVQQSEGLVVPRSAVVPDADQRVLFTVKNGKAVRHEVQLGLAAGGLVEVVGENLQAGDVVVILGNYELAEGMEVQTGEPAASRKGETGP